MKTVGIALLFGLCTLFGFRLAAKKTQRLNAVRTLLRDAQTVSDEIGAKNGSLKRIASRTDGVLFPMLAAYLKTLDAGGTEAEAAELACAGVPKASEERAALLLFLNGLSDASKDGVTERISALTPALRAAEAAAEAEAKQGRAFRCIGVLIGAGLAILLM